MFTQNIKILSQTKIKSGLKEEIEIDGEKYFRVSKPTSTYDWQTITNLVHRADVDLKSIDHVNKVAIWRWKA